MKKLIRNERVISLGVFLGLLAVAAVCTAVPLVVYSDHQMTIRAIHSERDLRATIVGRCTQTEQQKARQRVDLEGRIELYTVNAQVSLVNSFLNEAQRRQQAAAYDKAIVAARTALTGLGQPVDCQALFGQSVRFPAPTPSDGVGSAAQPVK